MKIVKVFSSFFFVFALSLALVGCSEKDYSENFEGKWEICSLEIDESIGPENELSSEDMIGLMESRGLSVFVEFNEDKTAFASLLGEEFNGTWKAVSETECSVVMGDETVFATLDGEKLRLKIEGTVMLFEKEVEESSLSVEE